MGHGSHDDHGHHGEHHNPNAIQEADDQLPLRVRSIELIKHNPNLFHLDPFNPKNAFEILGGVPWAASTAIGATFGYWYYSQKSRSLPPTFYPRILLTFTRIVLGSFVGGYFGYTKFGDRQRLQNAWVAERLRRRYPESLDLSTRDLWRFKGIKAGQQYYRWT